MLLNDYIVDIEKPNGICLPTFFWMKFQDYFYVHQSFKGYVRYIFASLFLVLIKL